MTRILPLLLPLLIIGCGGSSSNDSVANPRVRFTYGIDVTSSESNLKSMNDGTRVAGWNHLGGTATVSGETVTVDFLADVNYVNGSGTFGGYYTMTFPDSSTLTLASKGTATKNGDGSTNFTSPLTVLGGTGTYKNATGTGHFTGSRTGVLGAPVHLDVVADVC